MKKSVTRKREVQHTLNIDYEKMLLGILIMDNSKVGECQLESKHFLNPKNEMIYNNINYLYNSKKTFTVIDLAEIKELQPHIDYIANLTNDYAGSGVFERVQELQLEAYKQNLLLITANKVKNKVIGYDEALKELNSVNEVIDDKTTKTKLSHSEIIELITSDNKILKFNRFKKLSNVYQLKENVMNIVAARTSVGKSAFTINLMNDLADSYKCIYFNMEMTEKDMYSRFTGMNGSVPIKDFTDFNNRNEINRSVEKLSNKNYEIINGSKTIRSIESIIKRKARDEHVIVFIDYVGYIIGDKRKNDTQRVGEVVRELHRLTQDYNITMFVLAQINREGTEKPKLEHLKDSGELEQTGHAILLLHDPEGDLGMQKPTYEVYVAKNRSGLVGVYRTVFDKNVQRFYEVESEGR